LVIACWKQTVGADAVIGLKSHPLAKTNSAPLPLHSIICVANFSILK
jgi:hypothetical protein